MDAACKAVLGQLYNTQAAQHGSVAHVLLCIIINMTRPHSSRHSLQCFLTRRVNKYSYPFCQAFPAALYVILCLQLIGDDLEFNATGDPCYQVRPASLLVCVCELYHLLFECSGL
jgi:hypothetical protein